MWNTYWVTQLPHLICVPHRWCMWPHVEISHFTILLGKITGDLQNIPKHAKWMYFMFWTRENSFWVQRAITLTGQPMFHTWNRHFGSVILKIWSFIIFNEHTNTHRPSKQACINCKQGETSLHMFTLPLSNQWPCLHALQQHVLLFYGLLHQNVMLQLDFKNDIRNP